MSTNSNTTNPPPRGPRRRRWLLAVVPVLVIFGLTACQPTDIITTPVTIIGNLFGLGPNEVATPAFTIVNGIEVQVVVKAPVGESGVPVTVHVRCAGGTTASATVTLQNDGDISIGQYTFDQGWPDGADCVVSQQIVDGVTVAQQTITWLDDNGLLQANFLNS